MKGKGNNYRIRQNKIIILFLAFSLVYAGGILTEYKLSIYDELNLFHADNLERTYNFSLSNSDIFPPLLGDYPEFISPITESNRLEIPAVFKNDNSTLLVRSWRYSYNARGIIEFDNYLDGEKTVILVIHPWGIDDGQGFKTPEPNGVAFFGYSEKNKIYLEHTEKVLNPFIQNNRRDVKLICYTLPGKEDSVRV